MLYTRDKAMIDYDSKFDVLRYIIGNTSNSYGDEEGDNIIVFRDMGTGEVTGYTVMNFKRICKEMSEEYAEIAEMFDVEKAMKACN